MSSPYPFDEHPNEGDAPETGYPPETTYQEDDDAYWAANESMECGQLSDSLSQEDFENRRSDYGY